jgi:tRNA nucleotidyltransferase (CCA-adding enzyme)
MRLHNRIAKHLIEDLGKEVYLVGGANRDEILGIEPHDFDLAWNGRPDEALRLEIPGVKLVPTGIEQGVVNLVGEHETVELASWRLEYGYDGRKPTLVKMADTIEQDLARRDFSMNALARCMRTGNLVDPYNGVEDIRKKMIRCPGDTDQILADDVLRPLRGIRFHCQLGFDLHPSIERAVVKARAQANIAKLFVERVKVEFVKAFTVAPNGDFLVEAIELMDRFGYLKVFMPELLALKGVEQNKYHSYDVWTHTMEALRHAPKDFVTRVTILFHDIAKPLVREFRDADYGYSFHGHEIVGADLAYEILGRMLMHSFRDEVDTLIRNHLHFQKMKPSKRLKRLNVRKFGPGIIRKLADLQIADSMGKAIPDPRTREAIEGWVKDLEERATLVQREDLVVDGFVLMQQFGLKPGRVLGFVIKTLVEEVQDQALENSKDALLARAENLVNSAA